MLTWLKQDPSWVSKVLHWQYPATFRARRGAMHAGFEQFKAFDQDAIDNKDFLAQGKLTAPVLAVGGEKSLGPMMTVVMTAAATNVPETVATNSGHWLMEENSTATIKRITGFFEKCMKTIQLAGIVVITALNVASPALTSPRVWGGDPMQMIFDAQGGRHYYAYGYCACGPLVPPIGLPIVDTNATLLRSAPLCRDSRACQFAYSEVHGKR
jgi:hypothetical protein